MNPRSTSGTRRHRVRYRESHVLLEELAGASLERRRKEVMAELATVPPR
jgi:hypothetical protein